METRKDISEFLTSRRGRITPEQAGLPVYGSRRVPGLRREEVAVLAGVSVPYYTRLERGDLSGVSEGVLDALTNALQLDDAERSHLFDLARSAHPTTRLRRRRPKQVIRPSVQWVLGSMSGAAAVVGNARLDLLAANQLGHALFAEIYDSPAQPANFARYLFLDERGLDFYEDWDRAANETVAILRAEAGRDPHDRGLSDLVGELSTQSNEFRVRWAKHDVRFHNKAIKHIHHPVVGDLELSFDRLNLAADPGMAIFSYTAEPQSKSQEALDLLASWAGVATAAEADDPSRT